MILMYPATSVFLIEARNERTSHHDPDPETRCDEPACRACTVGWDETVFDVYRADGGELLKSDVRSMFGPPGAMWWQEMTEGRRPTGPDDYAGFTTADLDILRASFAEHPEHWRHGPNPADPTLPARSPSFTFADGPHLEVVCPNGHSWIIDSRANNCGSPYDYAHRCWIRHGEPPAITVDKNGATCTAGGGSILAGDYHGFLQHGVLTAG